MTGEPLEPGVADLAREVVATLRDGRIDEAETMYHRLCVLDERAREMLVIPVLIAIQRGQFLEALQFVNTFAPERCPELRVLCLQVMGDPAWYGEANALLDSPDPVIAAAMRQLLSLPEPEAQEAQEAQVEGKQTA